MKSLSSDIIIYLTESFLSDYDKVQLMAISKEYYELRFKFMFNKEISVYYILKNRLDYYDNFTNLIIEDENITLPIHIKHLTFVYCFNKPIKGYISNFVTHLTFFGCHTQELYENDIPKSVTNVKFIKN